MNTQRRLPFLFSALIGSLIAYAIACAPTDATRAEDSALATTTLEALRAQFQFAERSSADGTNAKLPARSVIPQASVKTLNVDGDGNFTSGNVTLPATALGATIVTNGKMSIAITLRGANSVAALSSSGSALYSGADSHGGHVVQTVAHDGVESFITFATSPGSDIVFDVSMAGVDGLRNLEGVIEFVDPTGAPRLRMSPPVVVDSHGVVTSAEVSIVGCAYDDSPSAPWGRKTTPPGASTCAIHISWSDAGLSYPVVLDPSWTTTASMAVARRWHGAILLPSLKVLAIAGEGISSPYLSSCELYDPVTGTWATTRALDLGRRRFTTTMVDNGKVLVAGGEVSSGRTAVASLYNVATGTWANTGTMTSSRAYHDAVYLASIGKVLVVGGMNTSGTILSSAELYNPASGTWATTGSLATARQALSLTALRDQTAFAVGGVGTTSNVLTSSEIYNAASGTWSAGPALSAGRQRHRAVRLADDRVLITGGFADAAATIPIALGEVYDSKAGMFYVQDSIGSARADHATLALPENRALVIGGSSGSSQLSDTQMFGGNNATSTSSGNLPTAVAQESATLMGNGYVLVAGGTSPTGITNVASTIGPYFYVYGRNGAAHQLQFTSVSGSWSTSFTLNLKWDSTNFSVVYDWVGGVGASLRATVRDSVGSLLGTVVTAHKGNSTLTAAGGTNVTENHNLVTASDVLFLDEKVIVVGPEKVFASILDEISHVVSPNLPPWLNEWFLTVRENVSVMSATDQENLWQALTDITADTTKTFHVKADSVSGQLKTIEAMDCTASDQTNLNCPNTMCPLTYYSTSLPWSWTDVDVVRAHYQIDHGVYPQFFKHHRYYLDQIESWIANPGGWQDTHGIYVLPFGHLPYWDSGNTIPDTGTAQSFTKAQIPTRNCDGTGGKPVSTVGYACTISGCFGFSACDWWEHTSFLNASYTFPLPGGIFGICNGAGSCSGDNTWLVPSSGCPNQDATTCTSSLQGIHCWHDCVHVGLENWMSPQPFDSFDSPGKPVFFLWHAWVDHLYGLRLDC